VLPLRCEVVHVQRGSKVEDAEAPVGPDDLGQGGVDGIDDRRRSKNGSRIRDEIGIEVDRRRPSHRQIVFRQPSDINAPGRLGLNGAERSTAERGQGQPQHLAG
jgi:hypothetical protein